MTKTLLPKRIVCGIDFYNKHVRRKPQLIEQFMRINSNSKQHKKNHIVISKKSFQEILNNNPEVAKYPEVLSSALRKIDLPEEIEAEENEITRNVEYAIYLSSISPFGTVILTTAERLKEYESNERYDGMKSITALADEQALLLIKDFYNTCMDKDAY